METMKMLQISEYMNLEPGFLSAWNIYDFTYSKDAPEFDVHPCCFDSQKSGTAKNQGLLSPLQMLTTHW